MAEPERGNEPATDTQQPTSTQETAAPQPETQQVAPQVQIAHVEPKLSNGSSDIEDEERAERDRIDLQHNISAKCVDTMHITYLHLQAGKPPS